MTAVKMKGPQIFQNIDEIVPGRVTMCVSWAIPASTASTFYFSIEDNPQYAYRPFFSDFGPLSIAQIHRFYVTLKNLIETRQEHIKFHSTPKPTALPNAVLLTAAFRMIHLGMDPEEALRPFLQILNLLKPFRDATSLPSTFDLTVEHCIYGLHKALELKWYTPDNFDVERWEYLEAVEHGDMNWLIPGKILAFATPYDTPIVQGWKVSTPQELVPVFRELGITHIIRLCKKFYNENVFVRSGFQHIELYFDDGTCPTPSIIRSFMSVVESDAVIAVHCKAGLGRT